MASPSWPKRLATSQCQRIYDRIAFAGVGKSKDHTQGGLNPCRRPEGLPYSRDDVYARSLANSYASFWVDLHPDMKPLEVEILVSVSGCPEDDQFSTSLRRDFRDSVATASSARSRPIATAGHRWTSSALTRLSRGRGPPVRTGPELCEDLECSALTHQRRAPSAAHRRGSAAHLGDHASRPHASHASGDRSTSTPPRRVHHRSPQAWPGPHRRHYLRSPDPV